MFLQSMWLLNAIVAILCVGSSLKHQRVRLFCGFVDYTQVHSSVAKRQGSNPLQAFLRRRATDTSQGAKKESFFLRMNGPRGRGRAETVITKHETHISTSSQEESDVARNVSSFCVPINEQEQGCAESVAGSGAAEVPADAITSVTPGSREGSSVESGQDVISDVVVPPREVGEVAPASSGTPTVLNGGLAPVASGPEHVARETGSGLNASGVSGSKVQSTGGSPESSSMHQSPNTGGSSPTEGFGMLGQLPKVVQFLNSPGKSSRGLKKIKENAKKALGALGLADDPGLIVHYECRFICLLLSVDEIVSALLGLQEI
jgi:hypothetical protein